MIEQIDEISNVEIEDFKLFQKQQKKYWNTVQAEYNKIGRRLVREAKAEYRKRNASRFKAYQISKGKVSSDQKPYTIAWKDEIEAWVETGQFATILVELPLHSDITDRDIWQMAEEKVG